MMRPAALLGKSRPPKKSFVFLLKEKNDREKIKKCRENFSVLLAVAERRRAETLGGIQSKSASGFSLKKVRISFSVRSKVSSKNRRNGDFLIELKYERDNA